RRRGAVEHAVQLGGVELPGVIAKLLLQRHALGKERASPGGVMPAGSSDQNARHFPCHPLPLSDAARARAPAALAEKERPRGRYVARELDQRRSGTMYA